MTSRSRSKRFLHNIDKASREIVRNPSTPGRAVARPVIEVRDGTNCPRPGAGLFPAPKEVTFRCSCPDAAGMCKHVAATLYGIGLRLDQEPELLFRLRGVDAKELIAKAGEGTPPARKGVAADRILDTSNLNDVFGIDLGGMGTEPLRDTTSEPSMASAKKPAKKHAAKAAISKRKPAARKIRRTAR